MKHQAAWRVIAFSTLCAGLWPAAGHSAPQCLSTWIAPGQRTVTPAEVTGTSQEKLVLLGHHPKDGNNYGNSLPDNGYVLTGDKVDLVTTCEGYAYVRFHGAKRVSTGWVDASRLQTTGPAYLPMPAHAAALCHAAEETLNRGEQLQHLGATAMDPKVLEALHLDPGWNASPAQVAHMTVEGRSLAATSIDSGGTCHSTTVYVLSGDLKSKLSPADRDDRDVENQGSDSWAFGVSEDLVNVLGQPMVMSSDVGSSTFHLSVIDKNGDIVPTCQGDLVDLQQRRIIASHDDDVCHAMLAGQQTPVVLQSPTSGHSLSLKQQPDSFVAAAVHDSSHAATQLRFHDNARAAEVEYTLNATGDADLDNSGKPRQIGLVSFFEGDSSAGCGDYSDTQVVPVYLDEQGRADPSSVANQGLASALPHGMEDGRLVTYAGKTYLELSPKLHGPSSSVWTIDAKGPSEVCSYQLKHYVVRPISG